MRVTAQQEPVSLAALAADSGTLIELVGHAADPHPVDAFLHGLWLNGGSLLTLSVTNTSPDISVSVKVLRQAMPGGPWTGITGAPGMSVAVTSSETATFDVSGYAVRVVVRYNTFTDFTLECAALVQAFN